MELPEDLKQKIREEERQRLAEEAYREQVRQELRSPPPPPSSQEGSAPGSHRRARVILLPGIVVVLSVIGLVIFHFYSLNRPAAATNQLPDKKLTTAQIAQGAAHSVVVVRTWNEQGRPTGQGSGYLVPGGAIAVTNYHVIRGAGSATVEVLGLGGIPVLNLLGYSIEHDLAALQLEHSVLGGIAADTAQSPNIGDHVVAIGSPLGLQSTVSEGIVSAVRELNGTQIIQTTAAISQGSSGGPLLNDYGRVIGLTTAFVQDGQNLNFAVSSRHIAELLANRRAIPFSEMLATTRVVDQLPENTLSVAPRNVATLNFTVNGQQGATLDGTYEIRGGSGNDVAVSLVSDGHTIINSGVVKESGQLRQHLPMGRYSILFDNRMSTFSSKSVSPSLTLTSYR